MDRWGWSGVCVWRQGQKQHAAGRPAGRPHHSSCALRWWCCVGMLLLTSHLILILRPCVGAWSSWLNHCCWFTTTLVVNNLSLTHTG